MQLYQGISVCVKPLDLVLEDLRVLVLNESYRFLVVDLYRPRVGDKQNSAWPQPSKVTNKLITG